MKFPVNVATITVAVALLTACAPEAKEDPAVEAMRAAAEATSQMSAALATVITAWDTGDYGYPGRNHVAWHAAYGARQERKQPR